MSSVNFAIAKNSTEAETGPQRLKPPISFQRGIPGLLYGVYRVLTGLITRGKMNRRSRRVLTYSIQMEIIH